ncbi:MAG: hypothetical protein V4671_11455 [Armatimonadota bacterium]
MGKRGPKPGTTYNTRPTATHPLRVENDKQLVLAQHFTERIERLIAEIDKQHYPVSHTDLHLVRRLVQTLEAVQSAVIDGISDYLLEDDRRLCAQERHEAAVPANSTFAIASRRPLPPS